MEWDDADDPPAGGAAGRPLRLLYAATAFGALVAVALAIIGVLLVRHELDKPDHRREAVVAKYQQQYRQCVQLGRTPAGCMGIVARRCAADPYWDGDVDAVARYCVFPVRSSPHG
jgi:hypothetical protein